MDNTNQAYFFVVSPTEQEQRQARRRAQWRTSKAKERANQKEQAEIINETSPILSGGQNELNDQDLLIEEESTGLLTVHNNDVDIVDFLERESLTESLTESDSVNDSVKGSVTVTVTERIDQLGGAEMPKIDRFEMMLHPENYIHEPGSAGALARFMVRQKNGEPSYDLRNIPEDLLPLAEHFCYRYHRAPMRWRGFRVDQYLARAKSVRVDARTPGTSVAKNATRPVDDLTAGFAHRSRQLVATIGGRKPST